MTTIFDNAKKEPEDTGQKTGAAANGEWLIRRRQVCFPDRLGECWIVTNDDRATGHVERGAIINIAGEANDAEVAAPS